MWGVFLLYSDFVRSYLANFLFVFEVCPATYYHPPTKLRQRSGFSWVYLSVHAVSHGPITHDALNLTA